MGRIKLYNAHQLQVDVKEFFVMKQLSMSVLAFAAIAFVPTACAADEEATPPKEATETSSESSGFNFAIPGEDTTPASSGFNFKMLKMRQKARQHWAKSIYLQTTAQPSKHSTQNWSFRKPRKGTPE